MQGKGFLKDLYNAQFYYTPKWYRLRDILQEIRKIKAGIKGNDRKWFLKHLGKGYMKDKEVHHDWDDGCKTYIFTIVEHKKLHKRN